MNRVPIKNKVTDRSGGWSTGTGIANSGSGSDSGAGAGGPATKARNPQRTEDGNSRNAHRAGRDNSVEVHHNGGTVGIKQGSTNPPR